MKAMRANDKRAGTLHAAPHGQTLACYAPPRCQFDNAEEFLEVERNNHMVSIMEWERCEASNTILRDALQRIGSDLGALCTIASRLDDTVALREYAALQGIVDLALRKADQP